MSGGLMSCGIMSGGLCPVGQRLRTGHRVFVPGVRSCASSMSMMSYWCSRGLLS